MMCGADSRLFRSIHFSHLGSHISHERAIAKDALNEYKTNHPEKFHH